MTTYLTRIPLSHPLVRSCRGLDDQNLLHKAVMSIFLGLAGPDGERRAANHVLFRLERQKDGTPSLLIQSSVAPASVTDGVDGVRVINATTILEGVAECEYARITVDVNTVTRNARNKSTHPVAEHDLGTWLAARFGDAITELVIRDSIPIRRTANKARLNVNSVVADVKVGDHSAFLRVLIEGIGRGKSYGCGLVLAQPVT